MPYRHPFRGFSSKNAYIRDQLSQGKTPTQIYKESGLSKNHVYTVASNYGTVDFKYIRKQARKRGLSFSELRRELMLVIERDKMVDAIMDDKED